jgi:uroporphyrinogen decarboxylase
MKAVADRYPAAAAVSNMDLSLEAEAFGAAVRFSDDEVPTVTGRLVDSLDDAVALKVPAVGAKRTKEAISAIRQALALIDDRPVLAGVIGPFSLAGRLMEMTEIMIKCMIEPETPHEVLKKATAFLIDYMREFKKIGANGIVMAEPAAGLLSPGLCDEFSSRYVKQIIDAVQDENFILVYHNCGNTAPLVDSIVSTGARVVHLGNAVKMADVIGEYPSDILVMGNVDPAGEFRNGTPQSIKDATRKLFAEVSHHGNWVVSSGCDIPPLSPLENIDAFFEAVAGFYEKR